MMKFSIIIGSLICALSFATAISAHELLPQEVIEFLQSNPNTTLQELSGFAATKEPM